MTRCPACGHHNGGHADDCEGSWRCLGDGCEGKLYPYPVVSHAVWHAPAREDDPNIINVPMSIETY